MKLKFLAAAIASLSLLPLPALAQQNVQVTSANRQQNGNLAITLNITWNEGVNFNTMFINIKDFRCSDRTGIVESMIGNVGIKSVSLFPNERKLFPETDAYGQAIAPLCR